MDKFEIEDGVLKKYNGRSATVRIPKNIKSIGKVGGLMSVSGVEYL